MKHWERIHVLVTRPAHQSQGLIVALSERGASVLSFPTLIIHPVTLEENVKEKILTLVDYDYVVFISPNAVNYGMPHLLSHFDLKYFKPQFATVGEGTADTLKNFGVKTVLFPENDIGALALLSCLPTNLSNKKVFVFKGDSGNQTLEDELKERGAVVNECICYKRIHTQEDPMPVLHALIRRGIDIIVLTSGESLRSLHALIPPHLLQDFYQTPLIVVSDRIKSVAELFGFQHTYVAKDASNDAIVNAVQAWYEGTKHE